MPRLYWSPPYVTALSLALTAPGLVAQPATQGTAEGADRPQRLEEMVVFGDPLRRQTLDTVSSISVVPEAQLQAQNIRDLYDLLLRTPNVNAAKEDKFSVRGISNEGIGPGGTGRPTVSVFIDGARQPGRGAGNTWDVEQVEFYRGPQSTAFGPGSLAGAIVLKSRALNYQDYSGSAKLGAANYGGREAGIALGGPLIDGLAFRYAGETNQTDGEVTNTTLNDDQWQARKRYLNRLKLGWQANDWYSLELTWQDTKLREGTEYLPPDNAEQRRSTDNVNGFFDDDSELYILRQTLTLNTALEVELIASHGESNSVRRGDYDVSAEDRGQFTNTTLKENQALELRLNVTTERLRAVLGAYYSEDELVGSSVNRGVNYSLSGLEVKADADLAADRSADTRALYSEADIDLDSRFTLTLGLRYEENDADNRSAFIVTGAQAVDPITGTPLPGDVGPLLAAVLDDDTSAPSGDTVLLPKLALSYDISDRLSSFVSFTQGYRAGSVDFVSDGNSPTYDPEYTDNYELGLKFSHRSWYVQAALFRIDYQDMQVGVRVDASNFRTDNAGEAQAQGAELEFSGDLGLGFSVFGGVGYTETEFTDYQDDEVSFDGKRFPNAPLATANLTLRYQHSSGFFADASWSRTGGSFTDRENTPTLRADARDLFGARAGWQGEQLGVELYGQNLTDKFYVTDRFVSESLGINAAFVGDPREYGIRLHYQLD